MRRLLIALSAVAVGCSHPKTTTDTAPAPSREVLRNLPGWFAKPPTDDKYLYGPATAVSRDLQIAINKAETEGRNNIAQQLEVKYSSLNKRFAEEVGRDAGSQLLDQYTQVYKSVVSQVLYGSRAKQQSMRVEGGVYRAFVLMELPVGEMAKKLMDQIRTQEQLYTRFRASESFKELDAEIERYEAWKRGRGE
ncbi:MAG: LPP20 family lipoprotein [Gemmatimonadaceae bacterium]